MGHSWPVAERESQFDLIIAGGGMTGLALACAIAGAGVPVLLIEQRALPDTTAPPFDGRVTAIARGSRHLLEGIGIWPHLAEEAQPILDIEVGERHSPLTVHYDHRAVGGEPLGHIVENRVIRRALLRRVAELSTGALAVAAPERWGQIERRADAADLALGSGQRVRARLLAAADGRGTPLRELAGIGVTRWDYRQTGIVATVAHAEPHHGRAFERFFATGPLAMLPMQGNRSSIVWAADDRLARELIALGDQNFIGELADRFGDRYGALELAGPRWHYPLSMAQARRYTDRRLVLVGDAARAIHPIAGQGWNLALRDVAALAELVVDARRLGLDPGGPYVLQRYERWRRFDSLALIGVTDGLNRLFANDLLPLRLARELGLGAVERIPPLKRFFMRHAMGLLGDLPRLMRGEAL
ncbi:MAG TPA: UbiH/UbiF/VisC/COQ6 family ubiquinone biosynthesis hydroxylase [Geminicoccaceae bacterium]|nr:UbiH/UbiF/VisC/COQ6 family ubiquinone biosynthesis hydroxylase [Geminicoccaceae bacterium]